MRKTVRAAVAALSLLAFAGQSQAQIIGSFPYTLTNGTLADANQVMSDFNYISSQVNANVATAISSAINSTVPALISAAVLTALPVGTIVDWSGSVASIPSPWQLCDGTNSTPNLKDKFLVGAGNTYAVGATGGQTSVTPTITVNGTALTQAQLPSYNLPVTDPGHAHGITDPGHSHGITDPGHVHGIISGDVIITGTFGYQSGASTAQAIGTIGNNIESHTTGVTVNSATTGITGTNSATTGISVASGGSGSTHTHTASSTAVATLPPYYALAKICKTS